MYRARSEEDDDLNEYDECKEDEEDEEDEEGEARSGCRAER